MVHTSSKMGRYLVILTVFCCVSQALCQQAVEPTQENRTRIIGGTPTTIQRYPFTVQVSERNAMICGGTLVSTRCVLSAAHCFYSASSSPRPKDYSVRIGTEHFNTGGVVHTVSKIVMHPQYNPRSSDSDLAMLVLAQHATLGPRVQAASVASYLVPDNAEVTVVGWGRTSTALYSSVLQEVRVRTVNHTLCASLYRPLALLITDNMLCAGLLYQGGTDACQGDSGGPVLLNGELVGVTSWGEGCGLPDYPGVKVRVSQFVRWIVTTANNHHNSGNSLGGLSASMLTLSVLASLAVITIS